jgi:hypothetical protein
MNIKTSAAYTSDRQDPGLPVGLPRTNAEIRSGFAYHATDNFIANHPMMSK